MQNPVKYVDPTGMVVEDPPSETGNKKGDTFYDRDNTELYTWNGNDTWEGDKGNSTVFLDEIVFNIVVSTTNLSDTDKSSWNNDPVQIIKTNEDGVSLSDGGSGNVPGIANTITQTSGSVIPLDADGWLSIFMSSAGRVPNPRKSDVYKLNGFDPNHKFWIINYASSGGIIVENKTIWQENTIWLQSASSLPKADSIRRVNLQKARNSVKHFRGFTIDSNVIGGNK